MVPVTELDVTDGTSKGGVGLDVRPHTDSTFPPLRGHHHRGREIGTYEAPRCVGTRASVSVCEQVRRN